MYLVIVTGIVFGLGAVLLVKFGNPGNYGFCAACQLRDVAGALGLHQTATLQYARPEIIGLILGAFGMSQANGEFRTRGGSTPVVRFVLGIAMMLGALVFLGCPLRGILRLAGGDLNGITGLAGFISGIGAGIVFLKRGFNLGRVRSPRGHGTFLGYAAGGASLLLLIGVAAGSSWLNFSSNGPGSQHAPLVVSLILAFVAGALAGRTRMCLSGGVRDYLLVRDTYLLKIYAVLFAAALLGNMYFGFFKLGFTGQPLAHTLHLWNFLGLFLTGLAATLAGGCPLRQLIMSGEGNTDAMVCVLGMLTGTGLAHNLNFAGSGAGVSVHGQVAVIVGIIVICGIGLMFRDDISNAAKGA